jgi:subtilisin
MRIADTVARERDAQRFSPEGVTMPQRAFLLIHLLVVLGLTLPTGLEAAPSAHRADSPQLTAPAARDPSADSPTLPWKRAKTRRTHHQQRRDNARRGQKHDRKQPARKPAGKQAQPRRQRQPVEVPSGRLPAAATVAAGAAAPLSAEDRYIVVLDKNAGNALRVANSMAAAAAGITPTHVYKNVFAGFAAVIPDDQLATVRNDPRVKAVVPDAVVHIAAQPTPPGIARINADLNPTAKIDGSDERVDVDVAIIDTAGDDDHPDLNIWAWSNCTDSPNDADDHGHGTHVGGTVGALDNDIGVVGVAPGARLWNFRVLKAVPAGGATGLNSWIICGLDLVTHYATPQADGLGDIEVANASLGAPGTDSNCQTDADPYHQAYCRAVAAGVTVVVSAMNDHQNAANVVPATFAEVITVSALADSDGKPGGLGPATSRGPDDTLATFSNFGADINIAAPGVDILSTVPTGACQHCNPTGFGEMSGTSMASPHVAGAAALMLAAHPGTPPAQVKTFLLAAREVVALPGDPDGIAEGVLRVATEPTTGPPPWVSTANPPKHKKQPKKHGGKKHGGKKHGGKKHGGKKR